MTQLENCRHVEVRGQVRGVWMNPPGEDGGGTFQLLLEDGATIVSPYPEAWHLEVGPRSRPTTCGAPSFPASANIRPTGSYNASGKSNRSEWLGLTIGNQRFVAT